MAWVYLFISSLFEVCWAIGMKYSDGFSKFWPSLFTIITMFIGIIILSFSLKTLPVGTAYAVWTGLGAIGAVILGIILFNEPVNFPRLFCLALIVIGILGLKLFTGK